MDMTQEELQKLLTSFEEEVGHLKEWQIDRNNQLASVASKGGKSVVNKMNDINRKSGHFEKLRNNKIGKKRDEETKQKIQLGTSHSWRAILQFDKNGNFIKEWQNFGDIERGLSIELNRKIVKQPIWAVCNQKPKHKSAYGFIWKYKN